VHADCFDFTSYSATKPESRAYLVLARNARAPTVHDLGSASWSQICGQR